MSANRAHVFKALRIGPVFCEYNTAKRIALDLPNGMTYARALETKLKTADAGKERADAHSLLQNSDPCRARRQ